MLCALAVVLTQGCVHTYQPLTGLHEPVVIDPQMPNLTDVRLLVYCVQSPGMNASEANVLCQHVEALFTNQGATVQAITATRQLRGSGFGDEEDGEAPQAADLIVELRSRQLHESNDPVLWALCYMTATLVPAVTEFSFAQDVTIRDGSGFLLLTDSLQGRIVRRFGVAVWAGNRLLDMFWRDDADKLTGDAANQDLSADLYRQLSQLVFNAKMRADVLKQTPEGTW